MVTNGKSHCHPVQNVHIALVASLIRSRCPWSHSRATCLADTTTPQIERFDLLARTGEFSREEYRQVTLRSLLGQLEVTAAVAEKMGAQISLPVSGVLQLMANYVGFVPPSEDVALPGDKVSFH